MNSEGVISARSGIVFTDEELFYSYRKAAAKGILKVKMRWCSGEMRGKEMRGKEMRGNEMRGKERGYHVARCSHIMIVLPYLILPYPTLPYPTLILTIPCPVLILSCLGDE